jgi:hypothetical protein
MTDSFSVQAPQATPAVALGMAALLGAAELPWPRILSSAYTVKRESATPSALSYLLTAKPQYSPSTTHRRLAEIYALLIADQEALGKEFEAVWDANTSRLYEE